MSEKHTTAEKNRGLLIRLLLIVAGMFAFAMFVMPPMYTVFCKVFSINGKPSLVAAKLPDMPADMSRRITVQFLADTDAGLPWDFRYNEPAVMFHPGEIVKTSFHVRNREATMVVARAVPSISPAEATPYFHKTECFCFSVQRLNGGEEKDMPLIFYVDPALPKGITTITLAYKFYNQTGKAQ